MNGRVIDDLSSEPVGTAGPAKITLGTRTVTADPSTGTFTFPGVPRESRVKVEAPGYFQNGALPTEEEIRLQPNSFTIQLNDAADPNKHIANADIRQGTTSLGTTTSRDPLRSEPHSSKVMASNVEVEA